MAKIKYKTEAEVLGDKQLQVYWRQLTESLRRKVIRQMLQAGATELKKAIRKEILSSVSAEASSRGGEPRYIKGRQQVPLAKTLATRAWSVHTKGILGQAVGARWPEGAQAHLVERGHVIHSHGVNTGRMTRALRFQERAARSVSAQIKRRQLAKMSEAIRKQHNAAKTKGLM